MSTVLGPGAYPRPPYGSFTGKVAGAGAGYQLLQRRHRPQQFSEPRVVRSVRRRSIFGISVAPTGDISWYKQPEPPPRFEFPLVSVLASAQPTFGETPEPPAPDTSVVLSYSLGDQIYKRTRFFQRQPSAPVPADIVRASLWARRRPAPWHLYRQEFRARGGRRPFGGTFAAPAPDTSVVLSYPLGEQIYKRIRFFQREPSGPVPSDVFRTSLWARRRPAPWYLYRQDVRVRTRRRSAFAAAAKGTFISRRQPVWSLFRQPQAQQIRRGFIGGVSGAGVAGRPRPPLWSLFHRPQPHRIRRGFTSGIPAAVKASGFYTVLGPGGYPRPPYGDFVGKAAAGAVGAVYRLLRPTHFVQRTEYREAAFRRRVALTAAAVGGAAPQKRSLWWLFRPAVHPRTNRSGVFPFAAPVVSGAPKRQRWWLFRKPVHRVRPRAVFGFAQPATVIKRNASLWTLFRKPQAERARPGFVSGVSAVVGMVGKSRSPLWSLFRRTESRQKPQEFVGGISAAGGVVGRPRLPLWSLFRRPQLQRIRRGFVGGISGAVKASGFYTVLGPGGYPRPPYGDFVGKAAAGAVGAVYRLLRPTHFVQRTEYREAAFRRRVALTAAGKVSAKRGRRHTPWQLFRRRGNRLRQDIAFGAGGVGAAFPRRRGRQSDVHRPVERRRAYMAGIRAVTPFFAGVHRRQAPRVHFAPANPPRQTLRGLAAAVISALVPDQRTFKVAARAICDIGARVSTKVGGRLSFKSGARTTHKVGSRGNFEVDE